MAKVATKKTGLAFITAMAAIFATATNAQIEEVFVTATKRAESAQSVGMAIDAYSSEKMAEYVLVCSGRLLLYPFCTFHCIETAVWPLLLPQSTE